jgi:thiol-disulfide isomerase/thioredoxin
MPMDTDRSKKTVGARTYALVALVAILAGFATVYLTLGREGNGRVADPALPAAQETGAAPANGAALAGLNRGAVAAFLVKKAPEGLPNVAFETGGGEPRTLEDWRGKVVLLNIWATWCAPCREEMPALDRLQAALGGEDFDVLAISIDRGGPEKAKAFLEEIGVKELGFYIDPSGKLFSQFKAVGMPTTLLIDRDGKEIGRLVGPAEWDAPEAVALIEAAIGKADRAAQAGSVGDVDGE